MTPRQTLYAALAVALLSLGAYWGGRSAGTASERARAADAAVVRHTVIVHRTDSVLKHDTAIVRRTLTKYDTARVTDTAVITIERPGKPETTVVYVPRAVADTVASVCRRLLADCGSAMAARDSLIAGLRLQVRTEQANRPGLVARYGAKLLWGAAGFGLGALVKR